MKRLIFCIYIPILFTIFLALLIWFLFSAKTSNEITIAITVCGGLTGFFFFIQKQQLEELQLFKELFNSFNARYDKINDSLNKIYKDDIRKPLEEKERDTLDDYFNLCAEEYLYFKKGYIYPEVWKAWCNGMWFFLQNKRIGEMWQGEEESNSYYGLRLTVISKQIMK